MPAVSSRPASIQMRLRSVEFTDSQTHNSSFARRSDQFDTNSGSEACCTNKFLPLHEAYLVNYHLVSGYWLRYGDASRIAGGIDSQIVNFDHLPLVKAICVPTLLCISISLISVTKLWHIILHQCVCNGRMGHATDLDSKSGWLTACKLGIDLPVMFTLESKI